MRNYVLLTGAVLAVASASAAQVQKPTVPTQVQKPTVPTRVQLTPQELTASERTPGSTAPLSYGVEPASARLNGVAGKPGPSPAYGPADAPVRVYLFTDFECPVCPRVVEPVKYLVRSHPKDVRLVIKMNALASHHSAARAAGAALAAFRQKKFWEYHDKLFANAGRLDDESLITYAKEVGLNMDRFRRDLNDKALIAQVQYESALAARLGLTNTPGFVINGTPQMGWGYYGLLESTVQREINRAKGIAAKGTARARVAREATREAGDKGKMFAAALFAK